MFMTLTWADYLITTQIEVIYNFFINLTWHGMLNANAIFAGFFGLFIGSFLNVVALRSVSGDNFILSRSKCFHCGIEIPIWRNMPVIGYLWNLGRSSCCNRKMPLRYILVEIAVSILFYFSFYSFELYPAIILSMLISAAVIGSLIDFDIQEIPYSVNISCFIFSLTLLYFFKVEGVPGDRIHLIEDILLKIAIGELTLFVSAIFAWFFFRYLFKREPFGFGDVFLLMGIYPIIGFYGVVASIQMGSLLAVFYVIINKILSGSIPETLPFGPWLFLGWFLYLFSLAGSGIIF